MVQMRSPNIPRLRLHNTGLSDRPFTDPADVVAHLGAVQCQDYPMAKWGLGLRMRDATDDAVERAFNEGRFLRTHVMRPTWHFVMAEDIRWMLELTAPRVKRTLALYDRRLGITEEVLSRSKTVFADALAGKHFLTRGELAGYLKRNDVPARGQRLAHIMVHAELDGLVCSGPRRGKQFTYALLEEVAPVVKAIGREEAIAKLAEKYFASHGPAQVGDLAWWSGLSVKDATRALDTIGPRLDRCVLEGKTYWSSPNTEALGPRPNGACHSQGARAFLLSIYDEYTIAYRDRTDISNERYLEKMFSMGNSLTAAMVIDGVVAGSWKRVLKKSSVEIALSPFRKVNRTEREAVEQAARRYGDFLNKETTVRWTS